MAPGQCFPLNGDHGYVDILLHNPIAITGFSLEHIPSAIAYDVTSAPNVVSLEVLAPPSTHKVKGAAFTPRRSHGPFRYDLKANSAVQTFSIFCESPEPVSFVRLKVRPWNSRGSIAWLIDIWAVCMQIWLQYLLSTYNICGNPDCRA